MDAKGVAPKFLEALLHPLQPARNLTELVWPVPVRPVEKKTKICDQNQDGRQRLSRNSKHSSWHVKCSVKTSTIQYDLRILAHPCHATAALWLLSVHPFCWYHPQCTSLQSHRPFSFLQLFPPVFILLLDSRILTFLWPSRVKLHVPWNNREVAEVRCSPQFWQEVTWGYGHTGHTAPMQGSDQSWDSFQVRIRES